MRSSPRIRGIILLCALGAIPSSHLHAQTGCAGVSSTPEAAANCAAHSISAHDVPELDREHAYTLAELVDVAERANPATRMAWEHARQAADNLGIARASYFPVLVGQALFLDTRFIEPFPEPLAPRGYVMGEEPTAEPSLNLQYLLFDFGGRHASVDAATAGKIAAGAQFIAANQKVAFTVSSAYYKLLTAEERLQAAKDTLKTNETTQDAAEAQLANGRATLPDVLNARAAAAESRFDVESADGDEKVARVELSEVVGFEPSPEIKIADEAGTPLPTELTAPVDKLIDRAIADRPDLAAQAAEIRAADDEIKKAKAEYLPKVGLSAKGAQTSVWPSADYGVLGQASMPTWTVAAQVEWKIFDGGVRKHELLSAESKKREATEDLREKKDAATREVWSAYLGFRTALRKEQAATDLLKASDTSYAASLDAYKYGVKNLVDVVTAEKQLATARLASVSARSALLVQAVELEYVTGNLLRTAPAATTTVPSATKSEGETKQP